MQLRDKKTSHPTSSAFRFFVTLEQLGLFVHFLKGVLDPDPWKRWTAHQAYMHPFLSGSSAYRIKSGGVGGAKPCDIHWVPPWDASISRRKLVAIQKTKEKAQILQQANNSSHSNNRGRRQSQISHLARERSAQRRSAAAFAMATART